MIYATHIPKRERKRALREVYAIEPVAPKFNPWSSCLITFDHRDHPTSVQHCGSAALVLDPIIDGFHLTRVLTDGGSSLNLLYQDTVRKMGINPSRIKPTRTTFKGVILGVEARCTGSITLEVVFGSPDNFRSEELIFDIVSQRLSRTAWTNRICSIQCGTSLRLSQAQDARTTWRHNSQWKYGTLPSYRGAHGGLSSRSTAQPFSAKS